jgi:DNA-binding beta-propeller fold protein YncE
MPDEGATRDQVGRYWDAFVGGADSLPADLDPGLTEVIHRVHNLAPKPRTAAKERVWQSVLANVEASRRSPNGSVAKAGSSGGQVQPMPGVASPMPGRFGGHRWLVAQFATAALLVVALVGSFFAFGPGRFDRRGESPAFISAIVATPALPVAEFLWQSAGDPALPLDDPVRMAIDPQGNLWVADGHNNQFQIFAPDGRFLEAWGTPGSGEGHFAFTGDGLFGGYGGGAVAFDADGNIYVADPANYRIQKFGPDRIFIAAWGSKGEDDGQFRALLDVAVDRQGRVYATDEGNNNVQVFDSDGRFLNAWGDSGAGGWLTSPNGITVDRDGNVWVAHFKQYRVQKYSPDGVLLTSIGEYGTGEGKLTMPNDVAVDDRGWVYVVDWSSHRVQVFDAAGRFLVGWGELGSGDGQFLGPNSVVVDSAGNVYVAEDGADRIQKFQLRPPPAPG